MPAATPAALAAFEQKMLREYPVSFFDVIVYPFLQGCGLERRIVCILGLHVEGKRGITRKVFTKKMRAESYIRPHIVFLS